MPRLLLSLVVLLALAASGCDTGHATRPDPVASLAAPVWPAPPAAPRIRWQQAFGSPRELGIARPMFERVLDGLLGRPEQRFVRPTGVAVQAGVVYVADPGVPALWILDPARGVYAEIGAAGGTPLAAPVAVAVRPDGAVFLADSVRHQVLLFDVHGAYLGVAASRDLERPVALAYAADQGTLYVADSARHHVVAFAPDGAVQRSWGEAGEQDGQFNHPSYLSQDRQGTLLVTDALNFRIQGFAPDGSLRWHFGRNGDGGGDFASPKGVACDRAGHVFVSDALFNAVQVFERDGTFLLSFGEAGAGPGQFALPTGLFIDGDDHIYVADGYNARVQVFAALTAQSGQEETR